MSEGRVSSLRARLAEKQCEAPKTLSGVEEPAGAQEYDYSAAPPDVMAVLNNLDKSVWYAVASSKGFVPPVKAPLAPPAPPPPPPPELPPQTAPVNPPEASLETAPLVKAKRGKAAEAAPAASSAALGDPWYVAATALGLAPGEEAVFEIVHTVRIRRRSV
jgi:hypothetical protein